MPVVDPPGAHAQRVHGLAISAGLAIPTLLGLLKLAREAITAVHDVLDLLDRMRERRPSERWGR